MGLSPQNHKMAKGIKCHHKPQGTLVSPCFLLIIAFKLLLAGSSRIKVQHAGVFVVSMIELFSAFIAKITPIQVFNMHSFGKDATRHLVLISTHKWEIMLFGAVLHIDNTIFPHKLSHITSLLPSESWARKLLQTITAVSYSTKIQIVHLQQYKLQFYTSGIEN